MPKDQLVSLAEAAGLLGVSKATLRNWDKSGQLRALRNPTNQYRMYQLSDVLALQKQMSLFPLQEVAAHEPKPAYGQPTRQELAKRLVRALHNAIRDSEASSNIIERFDEMTKLLYCRRMWEHSHGDGSPAGASGFGRTGIVESECVTSAIRSRYADLVQANEPLFPLRFREILLSDNTLVECVEILAQFDSFSSGQDIGGIAYEEVIRNTFDKGDNQQFFTPRPVVEFMCELLAEELAGVICDPACGTGGFLLGALEQARASRRPVELVGFEIDERLAWVTGINLLMHDAEQFSVKCLPDGGSLGKSITDWFGKVDAIITNPPFGSSVSTPEVLENLELGRGRKSRRRGVLFVERCLDLLRPGGVVAIVLDDGVLNSPSNKDVRKLILARSAVEGVFSIPETSFMPYASVKTSILVLRKRGRARPDLTRATLFARAEKVGRRPNGDPLLKTTGITGTVELDNDLPAILDLWKRFRSGKGDVPVHEEAEGYEVYSSEIPAVSSTAYARNGYRLDLLFNHPSRYAVAERLALSPYTAVPLNEIVEIRSESVTPRIELNGDLITYVGLASIESRSGRVTPELLDGGGLKSTVRRFRTGDILFAKMRPELRKVCLVSEEVGDGVVSSECLVLVPRKRAGDWAMLPKLLAALLRSDLAYGQLVHTVTGIGRPRVSRGAVLSLRLPVPPLDEQNRILELYWRGMQAADELEREAGATLRRAMQLRDEAREMLVTDLTEE